MSYRTLTAIMAAGFLGLASGASAQDSNPFDGIEKKIQSARFLYNAKQSELSANEIESLVNRLAKEKGLALQRVPNTASDSVMMRGVNDPTALLDIEPATGSFLFNGGIADIVGPQSTPGLPSAERAPAVALSLLSKLDLGPTQDGEMVVEHVGGLNMGARKEDGTVETYEKLVSVRFGRVLDGLSVQGPGSRMVVRMGEDGELAGVIRHWQNFESSFIPASERFSMNELQSLVGVRLQEAEAETVDREIESVEVVLFDDGQGTVEPALYVVAQLTMERTAEGAQGLGKVETFTNPYDFYVPLRRNPQARFPFMSSPVPNPQDIK